MSARGEDGASVSTIAGEGMTGEAVTLTWQAEHSYVLGSNLTPQRDDVPATT